MTTATMEPEARADAGFAGEPRTLLAKAAATAWLNAAIAASQDDSRGALYRTLSVEFFPSGIQFVGCDGTMLFRTWAPYSDIGDLPAPHPRSEEAPEDQVVVSDVDKFALGFMRTLLSAATDYDEIVVQVEPARRDEEPPLGEELDEYVLTLQAHGQKFACKLYEAPYPNWRGLEFGLKPAERVDGMTLATRLFQAVGKLKGIGGLDCAFRGEDRAIDFASADEGIPSIRGLLMPMRRPEKKTVPAPATEQMEHE